MTTIEIILIIVGIATIIASCFVVDNKKEEETQLGEYGELTDQIMFHQIQSMKDQVSKTLSNMKQQTVEHVEAQFNQISNEKIMAVNEYSNQVFEQIEKNHQEVVFLYNMLAEKEKELGETNKELQQTKKEVEQLQLKVNHEFKKCSLQQEETEEQEEQNFSKTMKDIMEIEHSNHRSEILELDKQGYSIREISRQLGLGQGEVKLVIDFSRKKTKLNQ